METDKTTTEAPIVAEEQEKSPPADDFFAPKKLKADTDDFINFMKTPREEVDAPPVDFGAEGESTEGDVEEQLDPDTIQAFDYTEDHEKTAEFFLMLFDRGAGFVGWAISGRDMDEYRKYAGKERPNDYDLSVTAAMVKKYQMKMSLEWMFASIIVMAYAPIMAKAVKDRREEKRKKEDEEKERQLQVLRETVPSPKMKAI